MVDQPFSAATAPTGDRDPALGKRLHPAIVTIDGPAASGKSTIGYAVAGLLDYLYFDTGILYRAVTLAALQSQTPIADEPGVTRLADAADIDLAAPAPACSDGRPLRLFSGAGQYRPGAAPHQRGAT